MAVVLCQLHRPMRYPNFLHGDQWSLQVRVFTGSHLPKCPKLSFAESYQEIRALWRRTTTLRNLYMTKNCIRQAGHLFLESETQIKASRPGQ